MGRGGGNKKKRKKEKKNKCKRENTLLNLEGASGSNMSMSVIHCSKMKGNAQL